MAARGLLFKRRTNKLLDILRAEEGTDVLQGTEDELAQRLNVSRTTARKIVHYLEEQQIVETVGRQRRLRRAPVESDFFPLDDRCAARSELAERFVLNKLARRDIQPGARFSELELAREAGCSTVTMREVLLRVSRLGIIEKAPRKQWRVVVFTEQMVDELTDLRALLERHSVECVLELDPSDAVFRTLEELLERHRALRHAIHENDETDLESFTQLDQDLHGTLMHACGNRYVDSFFSMLSFMVHYQIRPEEMGTERIRLAVQEHISLLEALLAGDRVEALAAMQAHMDSARRFLKMAAGVGDRDRTLHE